MRPIYIEDYAPGQTTDVQINPGQIRSFLTRYTNWYPELPVHLEIKFEWEASDTSIQGFAKVFDVTADQVASPIVEGTMDPGGSPKTVKVDITKTVDHAFLMTWGNASPRVMPKGGGTYILHWRVK